MRCFGALGETPRSCYIKVRRAEVVKVKKLTKYISSSEVIISMRPPTRTSNGNARRFFTLIGKKKMKSKNRKIDAETLD